MAEKIISFGVSMEEFEKIRKEAVSNNMSISMYCKSMILPETEFTKNYNYLIQKISNYPSDCIFTVRDLIGDEIWTDIPKGLKLAIGRHFYSQVNTGIIKNVTIKGYGAARMMRYAKKD